MCYRKNRFGSIFYAAAATIGALHAAPADAASLDDHVADAIRRGCRFAYYPEDNIARVAVDFTPAQVRLPAAAEAGGTVRAVDVLIRAVSDEQVLGSAQLEVTDAQAPAKRIELPELEGEYEAVYRLHGRETWTVSVPFERRRFPWEGNELGITDEVFDPFTPVSADGDGNVGIVLRDYQLDGLGLLRSVTSTDGELLARRMTLNYELPGGRTGRIEPTALELVSSNDAQAVYRGAGVGGGIAVDAEATVEFDGMVRVRWALRPVDEPVEVERLWLSIPLRAAQTPLMHQVVDANRINHAGRVPDGEGVIWTSAEGRRFADWRNTFNSYLWLGAEGPGLAWFAENDRDWLTARDGSDKAIQQVVRDGDVHRIEVMFANRRATIARAHHIEFGLQASPTKPQPENWRSMYPPPPGMSGPVHAWGGIQCAYKFPYKDDWSIVDKVLERQGTGDPTLDWFKAWATRNNPPMVHGKYPWLDRTTLFARRVADLPKDYPTLVYFEEMRASTIRPEWLTFQDQWGQQRFTDRQWPSEDVMRRGFLVGPYAHVTFPRSYRDYGAWYADEWLKRGVGLYWDNTHPKVSHDPRNSNAYFTEQGDLQPALMIFNQRAYQKRVWNLLQQRRATNTTPAPLHWSLHMTNTLLLPLHGLATIQLDHELQTAEPLPPDYIRTEMLGIQTGNIPHVLYPICGIVNPVTYGLKLEHLDRIDWGMRRVHEILPNHGWNDDGGPWEQVFRGFGYGQDHVRIHRYWDDAQPIETDSDKTLWLLLHDTERDQYLAVLSSWDAEQTSAHIRLNPEIFASPFAFADAETGEAIASESTSSVTVQLAPPYGMRMVLIHPADKKPHIGWTPRAPEAVAAETADAEPGDRIVGRGKSVKVKQPESSGPKQTSPRDPQAAKAAPKRGIDPEAVLFEDDFEDGLSKRWQRHDDIQVVADATGNHFARFTKPRQRLVSPPIPWLDVDAAKRKADALAQWSDYALRFRFRIGPYTEDTTDTGTVATWLQIAWRSHPTEAMTGQRQLAYLQMWRSTSEWRISGPFIRWNGNQPFDLEAVKKPTPRRGLGAKVDQDWHELEIRAVGDRTQLRFDGRTVFDGRDKRAAMGGFSIMTLFDQRAVPEYIDIDDVAAWRIETIETDDRDNADTSGDETETIAALRTAQAPTIDGKLDDQAWRAAEEAGVAEDQWVHYNPRSDEGMPLEYGRSAMLAYDERALYVAMNAEAEDPLALNVTGDGDPFQGDGLEVHINVIDGGYMQVGIGPTGRLMAGRLNSVQPISAIGHAAAYTKSGWATELEIPWSLLGVDPADEPRIRINLAANRATQGPDIAVPITATAGVFDVRDRGPFLKWVQPSDKSGRRANVLRVTSIDEALVIDGRLDEPVWQRASQVLQLEADRATPGAPPRRRHVRLLNDERHLYVAMRAKIGDADAVTQHADTFEAGDTLRIDLERHALGCNLTGRPLPIQLPYQIPFEARGSVHDGVWTLEMAIPWAQIGGRPEPGETIPFHITSHDSIHGTMNWQPTRDLRDLENFGQLMIEP